MLKHVIKYQYITGENPIPKNGCTIIEFAHERNESHNSVHVAVQQKLLDCHNLLRAKFPTFSFGVPNLIKIDSVTVISNKS